MKKILIGISVLSIVFFFTLNSTGWALELTESNALLPEKAQIEEKVHYNNLLKSKNKAELDKYLDGLNEKELLLTIAEATEELDKNGSIHEMILFANHVDKKLLDKLDDADYKEIIENPDFSDAFKNYMIDAYSFSKKKQGKKNSHDMNETLTAIVQNKGNSISLRLNALKKIDNFSLSYNQLLKDILVSDEGGIMKANCLKVLKTNNDKDIT